jgi:hypothetical protein
MLHIRFGGESENSHFGAHNQAYLNAGFGTVEAWGDVRWSPLSWHLVAIARFQVFVGFRPPGQYDGLQQ